MPFIIIAIAKYKVKLTLILEALIFRFEFRTVMDDTTPVRCVLSVQKGYKLYLTLEDC